MSLAYAMKDVSQAVRETMGGFRGDLADVKHMIGVPPRPTPEEVKYAELFQKWIRSAGTDRPEELRRLNDELLAKDTTLGSDPAGGFALPRETLLAFERYEIQASPARRLARVTPVKALDVRAPVLIRSEGAEEVGETDTRNETAAPEMLARSPTFGEISTIVEVSEHALQDIPGINTWLVEALADRIAVKETTQMVSGNGSNKFTGLLNSSPVTTTDDSSPQRDAGTLRYLPLLSGSPESLDPDALIDITHDIKEPYLGNASWLMTKEMSKAIRKLRTTGGVQIFPGGPLDPLLGFPVNLTASMPGLTANQHPLLFGDFRRGYLIADRTRVTISIEGVTKPGFVKFRVRRRAGGCVFNNEAVRAGKWASS